jgi:hypothetical protein
MFWAIELSVKKPCVLRKFGPSEWIVGVRMTPFGK